MLSAPQFFRTLADRTRLRIVNLLARGPLCVCDIQHVLGQPQSSVSRHLALLRTTGLLRDRRDGMRTFYELADWDVGLARGVLETLRRGLKAEVEYGQDLETLAALKAAGECHVEGSEPPSRVRALNAKPRTRSKRAVPRPGRRERAAAGPLRVVE